MTGRNPIPAAHAAHSCSDPIDAPPTQPLTDEERERIRQYYRSLSFKEFLAACPVEGIDLTREPEYPREVEL